MAQEIIIPVDRQALEQAQALISQANEIVQGQKTRPPKAVEAQKAVEAALKAVNDAIGSRVRMKLNTNRGPKAGMWEKVEG